MVNNDIYHILSLFVAIVIPLFIMYKTQSLEKKRASEAKILQEKHFIEQMEDSNKKHNERIELMNTYNRLSIMPNIYLNKEEVKFSMKDNKVVINLKFTNKGNGTANAIWFVYTKINNELIINSNGVFQNNMFKYYVNMPFDWNGNVPMVKECVSASIFFKLDESIYPINNDRFCDDLYFDIHFNDMLNNEYMQKYMLQYECIKGKFEKLRVETYPPKLIEDKNLFY